MSFDTSSPQVKFAIGAVRKASALSLRVQTGMAEMKLTKSDFSPVTVADFAAQALVAKALIVFDASSVLVGEEDSSSFEGVVWLRLCSPSSRTDWKPSCLRESGLTIRTRSLSLSASCERTKVRASFTAYARRSLR